MYKISPYIYLHYVIFSRSFFYLRKFSQTLSTTSLVSHCMFLKLIRIISAARVKFRHHFKGKHKLLLGFERFISIRERKNILSAVKSRPRYLVDIFQKRNFKLLLAPSLSLGSPHSFVTLPKKQHYFEGHLFLFLQKKRLIGFRVRRSGRTLELILSNSASHRRKHDKLYNTLIF